MHALSDVYVPAAHVVVVHADAPAPEYLLDAHNWQLVAVYVEVVPTEYVPGLHSVHAVELTALATYPAGHAVAVVAPSVQ